LFTDGLANHGVSSTDGILKAMGSDFGCSVHTFGFGSDHDANMLKAISDRGSGVYFFLKDKDDIPDAFADCMGGLLSVVGQNISLQLKGINGVTIKKIYTKFKTSSDSAGVHTVAIGDIQSEEERDILASVELPAGDQSESVPIVEARLGYFNVVASRQDDRVLTISLARPEAVAEGSGKANYKVDLQRNRLTAADAISEAKVLGEQRKFPEARAIVEKAQAVLKASLSKDDKYTVALLGDLQRTLEGLVDNTSFTTGGYQAMNSMAGAHYNQRSAGKNASPAYETSSRLQSKSAYKF